MISCDLAVTFQWVHTASAAGPGAGGLVVVGFDVVGVVVVGGAVVVGGGSEHSRSPPTMASTL